jgi:hypothetical protein
MAAKTTNKDEDGRSKRIETSGHGCWNLASDSITTTTGLHWHRDFAMK